MRRSLGRVLPWVHCALCCLRWQELSIPLNAEMWSLCAKGLCPDWEVQSASVSGDQLHWKAPKRLFHPWFGSLSAERVGCATGSAIFQGVGYPEKSLYTIVAVMAWCCFFPCVTRHAVVWWNSNGWGLGYGVEFSGHQRACWHSQTVLKPCHSKEKLFNTQPYLLVGV